MAFKCPTAIQAADVMAGFTFYCVTGLVVLLGVFFGNGLLPLPGSASVSPHGSALESFFCYDALHYKSICLSGYRYDPSQRSEIAFFPAYPLLARGVMRLANFPAEWCSYSSPTYP